MIQSEKHPAASKSVSAMGTTADLRAGPIRLQVRAPQIPEFRLESSPAQPRSFVARAPVLEPAPRAHLTKPATASPDHAASDELLVILHHNGNQFSVRASMALIFQNHAAQVLAAGESELVVLAHVRGVELLLITPKTPFHFGVSLAVGAERAIPSHSRPRPTTHGVRARAPLPRRPHGLTATDPRSAELTLSA